MGWDIAMKTFCNIFTPFTWGVMCDRYPPFATLINRIPLFPPRMKKEKKPDTDTSGIFDKYSWGSKSALFLSRILFFRTEKQETYFSALHIHMVIDVAIWSVTRVWQLRPKTRLSFQITKTKTPLNQIRRNMKSYCNRNRSNLSNYLLSDSFHRVLGRI